MAAAGWSTEQTKTKIRSVGRIGRFTCDYVACKAITFAACLLNHLLSSSPVIPSILKAQLSTVEQQNKDRTAHHSVSERLYSNPSCAIIVTYLPIAREFQKVVWTLKHWIRFCQMRILMCITVWTRLCSWSRCISTCANNAYINLAVLSSLPPSDSLSLSSGYWSFMFPCLHYVCMGSWWLQQSLSNLCIVTCSNTCLPQTHNTRLCWALPFDFKQGLSCPCSAINTVPGDDGHRARNGRAERSCVALGLLCSYSVCKAPWCSEKNGWTASWGGTWWGRKAFERSVSV